MFLFHAIEQVCNLVSFRRGYGHKKTHQMYHFPLAYLVYPKPYRRTATGLPLAAAGRLQILRAPLVHNPNWSGLRSGAMCTRCRLPGSSTLCVAVAVAVKRNPFAVFLFRFVGAARNRQLSVHRPFGGNVCGRPIGHVFAGAQCIQCSICLTPGGAFFVGRMRCIRHQSVPPSIMHVSRSDTCIGGHAMHC